MSADRNTSKGAPLRTCVAILPDALSTLCVSIPVSFLNSAERSSNTYLRLAAIATVRGAACTSVVASNRPDATSICAASIFIIFVFITRFPFYYHAIYWHAIVRMKLAGGLSWHAHPAYRLD